MKNRIFKTKGVQCSQRYRDAMTLVEVVVALAITGLTVAGIATGYIYCSTATTKDALYMAANARAQERIEQTRSARWDTSSWPAVDQVVATNFPDEIVTLDKFSTGTNIVTATLQTSISQISTSPPVKQIRVDCIWQFKGEELITNTIETCRAPDQ